MHEIFKQWSQDLIPVQITKNEKGKKDARPYPWQNGQTYTTFNLNSIALRTGENSVNVIDVDTKDLSSLVEPFKSWVDDRMLFEDTLIVETLNGYHFYFNSKVFKLRSAIKTGANQSKMDFIDFRGEGGLIFIDSESEIASYKVISDAEPTEDIADIINHLPKYEEVVESEEEVVGFSNLDDTDDITVESVPSGNKLNLNEVMLKMNLLSADCSRDEWLQLMASAYNILDKNHSELKEPLREWSKTSDSYDDKGFNLAWNQINSGKFGKAFKGGLLIKKYNEALEENYDELREVKYKNVVNKISNAKTIEDIKNIFTDGDWKSQPICSHEQQKVLPSLCAERARLIHKENGDKTKVTVAEYKPLILVKEKKKRVAIEDVQSYYCDNKFNITHGDKILEEVYKGSLGTIGVALGYPADDFSEHIAFNSILVQGIKKETDYTISDEVEFSLGASKNPSELEYLKVLTNPLHQVITKASRTDIVEDFFDNIWNGKAEDIVRLIGLTMRFKEGKLNKVHVVAPSNTGKTTFLEQLGFQTIHMKRLIQALSADKGIGKNIIDGLKSSGFLLIDEANDALTQDIKNIDNYIQLDQFGQGGTQEIKLHFTCLTSTHKTAVRGMSDEMYNRLMLVQLTRDEMKYTLDKSSLFINETHTYTETITQQVKWLLKDALSNPEYTKDTLVAIQDKYRLELNDDVSEMLTEISERIVDEYKALATENGEVILREGEYFIKRKKDLVQAIEDRFTEYSHIDKGKYSDELLGHFLSDIRVSLRINGDTPKSFYKLNLKKYYSDMDSEVTQDAIITDMFDDLDEY